MKFNIFKNIFLLFFCTGITSLFSQEMSVEYITFRGNKVIPENKLYKAIKTTQEPWYNFFLFWKESKIFDEKVFLNDLLRIEKYYHNEGFLDAIVKDYKLNYSGKKDEVGILINIREGTPTTVKKVLFSASGKTGLPFDKEELKRIITLKPGKRYREEDLRTDYNVIINYFSNKGYPFVEARVKPDIDEKSNYVTLMWRIDPGKYCEFGTITITGNESVSEHVIRRGLDFKTGQPFSQRKLHSAQSRIYRLELFQYVNLKATHVKKRPEQLPINLEVRERELKTIELGVGYGTEESFRIRTDLTHRNFIGGARILRTEIKHSTRILPLNVKLEFSQPFFFDDQNDLYIRPFFTWQDEKSFEVRRLGFETTVNRRLNSNTRVFVTNRFSRDTVRIKYEAEFEKLADFYNKSILLTGFRRNTTDQLFTPTRGSILHFTVEEAGLLFQSKFRYYKLFGEYRHYHQLSPEWILASRILMGTMTGFGGSETTPVEERFFAGGSYSVRGWNRQELGPHRINPENGNRIPVGGNSKLEGGIELRYPIYKKLKGALLLDYGDVWSRWNGFDLLSLKYALGIGFRYNTPIGPVRIDFARKLNRQFVNEDRYNIHISIGHAF